MFIMILHCVHVLTLFRHSIILVVMETKVSTLAIWVFGQSKEDVRLNSV